MDWYGTGIDGPCKCLTDNSKSILLVSFNQLTWLILQFNYTIHLVADSKYGAIEDKTNEWTGMVRELIDRVRHNHSVSHTIQCAHYATVSDCRLVAFVRCVAMLLYISLLMSQLLFTV